MKITHKSTKTQYQNQTLKRNRGKIKKKPIKIITSWWREKCKWNGDKIG